MRIISDRNTNFTIWNIEDNGKMATVDLSTGRKVDENNQFDKVKIEKGIAKNGYVNESFRFVRFVGQAYNKLKKHDLKEKDRITNLSMNWDFEGFWNESTQAIEYPKYPRITVFSFDIPGEEDSGDNNNTQTPRNIDKAPEVYEEDPFDTAKTPEPKGSEDEEENPF